MRPIKLKISGLNSYIETQTIEFDKLTERGLFGIFGPTGCGKSTILDAMILSLYGHKGQKGIPRSTNEFINTATDQASMSLLFGIDTDDGPRHVLVERKFKRTQTGLATSFSRLQVLSEAGDLIDVWDKTTEVTNQVVEILGLTREDFMRSVVLPQGKFSEFLTLEGVARRDMLERLLNLRAYGSALQRKIKERGDQLRNRMLQLEGEMKRFSDLTPELIDELKDEYVNAQKLEKKLKLDFESTEKEKASLSRLNTIIESLKNFRIKEVQLCEKQDDVKKEEFKIERADMAEKIWPYYTQLEKLEASFETLGQSLKIDELSFKNKEEQYLEKKAAFESFEATYNQSKEALSVRKASIEKVKEHQQKADELTKERLELRTSYKAYKNEFDAFALEQENLSKAILDNNTKMKILETEKTQSYVESDERVRIAEGLKFEEQAAKLQKNYEKTDAARKISLEERTTRKSTYETHMKAAETLKADLGLMEISMKELSEKVLGYPSKIGALELEKGELALSIREMTRQLSEKKKIEIKLDSVKEMLKADESRLIKANAELDTAKEKLELAEKGRLKYWEETVLTTLSENLSHGDTCPLCGSDQHPKLHTAKNIVDDSNWAEAEDLWRSAKLKFDQVVSVKERNEEHLAEEISKLDVYSNIKSEILQAKESDLKILETQRAELEKDNHKLTQQLEEQKRVFNESTNKSEKQEISLKAEEKEILRLDAQLEAFETQLSTYSAELKVLEEVRPAEDTKSYKELYSDLQLKDKQHKLAEEGLVVLRKSGDADRIKLETLTRKTNELKIQMEKVMERGSGLKERIKSHVTEVKSVTGEKSIDEVLNEVQLELESLSNNHTRLKLEKTELENALKVLSGKLEGLRGQLSQVTTDKSASENKLNKIFESSPISSIEILKDAYVEITELQKRKAELKAYHEERTLLSDRINELEKERAQRDLSEKEWNAFVEKYEALKVQVSEASENKTALHERLKVVEKESKALQGLTSQYKKYQHVQDLVADLIDLVRGNKFVEYVALTHLRYIALDASKRLMDITNHRYSLELDTKGNFIICDHYNGGVKRDTKTLSGGETFLTALSLSLALSSQIQLKGRTNLEFFFLDEGFGTLDNELLDIVMTSLEKLFHEKLTVGIISHVDELKNRVPIKLTVEPAKAGVHGTKTKIEVT